MNTSNKFTEYLDKQGWKYQSNPKGIVFFGIKTPKSNINCILDLDSSDNKVVFFSLFPNYTSEEKRVELAQLLIRLNLKLYFGSFEMDFKDGEVRFKTSLVFGDCLLTDTVIEHIIKGNIATMDAYFNILDLFISEKVDLKEAIDLVENLQIQFQGKE